MQIEEMQKELSSIWGGWVIKERLGKGSFGSVYRIERQEFGRVYESALKVIRIPTDESEINVLLNDGMDDESIRTYLGSVVEDIVNEVALMYKLRGNSNIVSYEDHYVIEVKDRIGWNIYIRMELLTPLFDYMRHRKLTVRDVIRMGLDMCSALEVCQKYNIIHRDIKPENMFVSDLGVYKLGDFGIARQVERTSTNLSKKGTYTYMAPELYKGEACNSSVDIYSLGIVLYRFLNNNRTPFLPPYPQPLKISDKEKANVLRMSGKPMPEPCNAKGRLAEIVLKACEYDPKNRYESAALMKEALELVLYDEDEVGLIYPEGDQVNRDHEFIDSASQSSDSRSGPKTMPVSEDDISDPEQEEEESLYYLFRTEVAQEKKEELLRKARMAADSKNVPEDEGKEGPEEGEKEGPGDEPENGIKTGKDVTDQKEETEEKENTKDKESTKDKENTKDKEISKDKEKTQDKDSTKDKENTKDKDNTKHKEDTENKEEAEKDQTVLPADGKEDPEEDRSEENDDSDNNTVITPPPVNFKKIAVAVLALALLGGGAFGGYRYYQKTLEREVPLLMNIPLESAEIKAAGDDESLLVVKTGEEYSETVDKGNIISQDIAPGTIVKKGDEIHVVISKGGLAEVPDVLGAKSSSAEEMVTKANLKYKVSGKKYSDNVAKGKVISQEPQAGSTLEEYETVSVVISKGIEQVSVPALAGKTLDKAKEAIKKAKLKFGASTEEYSSSVDSGKVIRQSIDEGKTVDKNMKIDLVVSKGPEPEPEPEPTYSSYSSSSGSSSKSSSRKKSSKKKSSKKKSSGGGDSISNWDLVN